MKSIELNIGMFLYFISVGICLMVSFVFRLCLHLILSLVVRGSLSSVAESGCSCAPGSSLKLCSHGYLWPAAVPRDPNPHSCVCPSGVRWEV